jgi:hypothetical protein
MSTQTESVKNLFEDVFESLRKASEANIEAQQELFRQWSATWPGLPQPQNAWLERAQKFQKEWANTAKDLLAKHQDVLDAEYELAVDSLEEAFRLAQSADPQDFAKRCENLCRKALESVRDVGEMQLKETQEALSRWMALAVKSAK